MLPFSIAVPACKQPAMTGRNRSTIFVYFTHKSPKTIKAFDWTAQFPDSMLQWSSRAKTLSDCFAKVASRKHNFPSATKAWARIDTGVEPKLLQRPTGKESVINAWTYSINCLLGRSHIPRTNSTVVTFAWSCRVLVFKAFSAPSSLAQNPTMEISPTVKRILDTRDVASTSRLSVDKAFSQLA